MNVGYLTLPVIARLWTLCVVYRTDSGSCQVCLCVFFVLFNTRWVQYSLLVLVDFHSPDLVFTRAERFLPDLFFRHSPQVNNHARGRGIRTPNLYLQKLTWTSRAMCTWFSWGVPPFFFSDLGFRLYPFLTTTVIIVVTRCARYRHCPLKKISHRKPIIFVQPTRHSHVHHLHTQMYDTMSQD